MTAVKIRVCRTAFISVLVFVTIAGIFFYFRYLDLKKTLILSLSARASSAAGQEVKIGDLFLTPSGVVIGDIRIENQAGSAPGDLLRIKRVSLRPDFRDLLKGRLHIIHIDISGPELDIRRNREGKWNISDRLLNYLSKKSTRAYRIDEIRIRSGVFDFNGDRRLRNEQIDATISGLSSNRGSRTLLDVSTHAAGNGLKIKGWAYLNDRPKKFLFTLESKGFSLSAFGLPSAMYKVDARKMQIDFSITADGDDEKGIAIRSDIRAQKKAFLFFRRAGDVRLTSDVFFNLKDRKLLVKNACLRSDEGSSVALQGEIDDIRKASRYRAKILASRIALADIRILTDIMIGGTIVTDGMEIKGAEGQVIPELSGAAVFNDVYMRSATADVERINGKVAFLPGRGLSIRADATANISKAGSFLPASPAHIRLTLFASKERGDMSFSSSAAVSTFEMAAGKKRISAGSAVLNADGRIANRKLSCKNTIEVKDLRYSGNSIPVLRAASSLDSDGHSLTARDLKFSAGNITATASLIHLGPAGSDGGYAMKVTGLDASYPEDKAAVEGMDISLALRRQEPLSGNIIFSAGKIIFRGAGADHMTGRGDFDGEKFSIEVPNADISGGKMHLSAQGKTSGDHFPLSITARADNVNMERLSSAASAFVHSPYGLSGLLLHASFEGTINSPEDIRGLASLSCSGVSASSMTSKKTIVKDMSADADLTFKGKDLAFGVKAAAGAVPVRISGEVQRFLQKEKTYTIRIDLPEVKAATVRDSFWDIFPDSLLYAGINGSISSHIEVSSGKGILRTDGNLALKDFTITGENDEYSLGPVNGVIPVGYRSQAGREHDVYLPSFDRQNFENLKGIYSGERVEAGFNRITIGSFRYGFRLMDDISLFVRQQNGVYTIGRLSANIFGGKLNGSAVITSNGSPGYRGGIMVERLSLKRMCDDIDPIRGYITGKVDGVMAFKGSGVGLSGLIGKGDFWTYSSGGEKTRISREFLRKIAGPSLKSYIGDRNFDKGVMSFYLQNGLLIFRDLEISNRNFFGMRDLSVKVAPFNNKIAIDQLMWSITEAAQRAKKE